MIEQWIKWEPVQGLTKKYYIDAISDNMEGFKIVFSEAHDKNKKIAMLFGDSVDAYRSRYESFRQKITYELEKQYGTKFYAEWTFFKVTNSTYIHWLSEQSYGITDSLTFTHFSFLAMDSVVDIIASCEPKIVLGYP